MKFITTKPLNTTFQFDQTVLKPNVSDIAILVISAISQQGSSTELKGRVLLKCITRTRRIVRLSNLNSTGTLGRAVMFILFLAFVFLYTSYSASIVALLQSSSDKIRTLSDLLNSKLELGSEDTPYNRHYFAVIRFNIFWFYLKIGKYLYLPPQYWPRRRI